MTAHSAIPRPARRRTASSAKPIPLRPQQERQVWGATLERLCGTIGERIVRVVIAPRGIDVAISGARLFDPLDEQPAHRDELVLGVGLDGYGRETLRAVAAIAAARGAGIVLRTARGVGHDVLDEAERLGVAILAAAPGAEWGQLHALMTATAGRGVNDDGPADAIASACDDLPALADATAALAGGPVTIEDAQLRVLAFSRCEGNLDDERVSTILARRTPDHIVKQLRASGVVARVADADDVVAFAVPDMCPRRAIAIRAGGLVLGYVWACEAGEPLSRHADVALREAARLAAPLLLRQRVAIDLERRVRGDLLRTLLNGRGSVRAVAAELPLAAAEHTVVAYDLADADADQALLLEARAIDFVSMYFRSYRREAHVVADGRRVFALVADEHGQSREALALVVRESVASMSQALKLELHAGIGTTATTLEEIAASRVAAEQALRVGASLREPVADIDDVRGESFLLELAEYVAERPRPLAKPLRTLYEHDRLNGTDYVETLTVYLDCFGNSALAAERLHIHPNTLRYRLRRLTELAGVDLEQPAQRFALELQLRLIVPAQRRSG